MVIGLFMTQVRACSANTELLGGTGRGDLHTDCHFKEQTCLGKGRSGGGGSSTRSEFWKDDAVRKVDGL